MHLQVLVSIVHQLPSILLMDLCLDEKRRQGPKVVKGWWEKKALDFSGDAGGGSGGGTYEGVGEDG